MFYILRFYLENKIPQALCSYTQEFYGWTTDPTEALAFVTKEGALSAVANIQRHCATAKHHRFVVANVSEVPIGTYSGSDIQGFLSW